MNAGWTIARTVIINLGFTSLTTTNKRKILIQSESIQIKRISYLTSIRKCREKKYLSFIYVKGAFHRSCKVMEKYKYYLSHCKVSCSFLMSNYYACVKKLIHLLFCINVWHCICFINIHRYVYRHVIISYVWVLFNYWFSMIKLNISEPKNELFIGHDCFHGNRKTYSLKVMKY